MTTRQPPSDVKQRGGEADESTAGESPEESAPATLSMDVTFGLLKNRRRRETLQYLREHDGEARLDEVAEHIAALENETTVAALSSDQRKRVYIGLYQCHLPKLDDAGVVDYDQDRGTILMNETAEQLFHYLDPPTEGTDDGVGTLALASVAVGAIVVASVTSGVLDVWQFGAVPEAAWAIVGATAAVGIAGIHLRLAGQT
jgi:hypothetical protein